MKPSNAPGRINARRQSVLWRMENPRKSRTYTKGETEKREAEMATLRARIVSPDAARAVRTKKFRGSRQSA